MTKKLVYLVIAVIAVVVVIAIAATGGSNKPKASTTSSTVYHAQSASGLSDGTYLAGTDIQAGTYRTPGPGSTDILNSCYWERDKDDSGKPESIIANDNITGPGRITVHNGEILKLSGGCNWQLVIN